MLKQKWEPLSVLLSAAAAMSLSASIVTAAPIAISNHSFQSPDPGADGNIEDEDPYDVANGNPAPSNWTFANSANDNYGQQRPHPVNHFTRDTTGGERSPFTLGGFDEDLIVFANMNTPGASFQADSDVVGQLEAGTYSLTVAVGGRNTGSWNDLDYSIGLVGAVSGPIGTPTAVTINPGNADMNTASSPWTTNEYNVVDVTYTLDVPPGSGLIGEDYSVRIIAANSGFHDGVADTDFAQAAIDNVRLDFQAIPEPSSMALVLAVLLSLLCVRRK